jgi:hypothetical protein
MNAQKAQQKILIIILCAYKGGLVENRTIYMPADQLENGDYAYAFFNLGEVDEAVGFSLDIGGAVRDLWAKEDIAHSGTFKATVLPHTAKIIKSSTKLTF